MKKPVNMGRITRTGSVLLYTTGSPPKSGLSTEPSRKTGIMNNNEKSQYPTPTRQSSNRLNKRLKPALPPAAEVMMIPETDAEKTDARAKPEGMIPFATRRIMLAPRVVAKMKYEANGFFMMRFCSIHEAPGRDVYSCAA
jgi:hypothetical protein